jgi:tyrosinase
VKAEDPETTTTPLYPFRASEDEDGWYQSINGSDETSLKTSVKRTEPFGYTYPETDGLTYPLSDDAKSTLKEAIDEKYVNAASLIQQSKAGNKKAGDILLPQVALLKETLIKKVASNVSTTMQLVSHLPAPQVLLQDSIGPDKPYLKNLAPKNEYLEWLVNIKAEKHALGGKYSVHVFLNPVEEDNVALWRLSPHYVGSFVPFGQARNTGCGNCKTQQQDHMQITSQIPLTVALIERYLAGILPNINEETVIPYLTENLHWRVESVSHTIILFTRFKSG